MGALAGLFPQNRPSLVTLGALGGSYFSASVAARGLNSQWEDLIQSAAADTGVDPLLIKAIISAESSWNPTACSSSSCGLMQLNVQAQGITKAQALDPSFNIPFGARVIAEQLAKRPTTALAIAGYNAGTSRTDDDLTQRIAANTKGVGTYVQTVLDFLTWFQTQQAGTATEAPPEATAPSATDVSQATMNGGSGDGGTILGAPTWLWWVAGGAVVLIAAVSYANR
jgi:soluble lytic murein transglycosylase-like protein